MDELSAGASPDAAAWFDQGEALFKQEQYAEALAAYERAIELNPLDARFFAGKGAALGNLGRRVEALAANAQAIALDPHNLRAWYNNGIRVLPSVPSIHLDVSRSICYAAQVDESA